MIAKDPEINVEELKNRIREEVGRRGDLLGGGIPTLRTAPRIDEEPHYSEALQFPLAQRSPRQTVDKLPGILEQARDKTEVNRWIPKVFRRLFRKQGGFNRLLLESLRVLLKSLRELRNENSEIRAYLEAQYYWMRDFAGERLEDRRSLRRLKLVSVRQAEIAGLLRTQLNRHGEDRRETKDLISFVLREIDAMRSVQSFLASRGQRLEEDAATLANLLADAQANQERSLAETRANQERSLAETRANQERSLAEALANQEHSLAEARANQERSLAEARANQERLTEEMAAAQQNLLKLATQFEALDSTVLRVERVTADLGNKVHAETQARANVADEMMGKLAQLVQVQIEAFAVAEKLRQMEERQLSDFSYLKGEISLQQQGPTEQLEAITRKSSKKQNNVPLHARALDHRFDSLYLAFEDRFRGARSEIKSRLEFYLPYLANLPWPKKDVRVLDVGCGRGEWLGLLKEKGYSKIEGVDANIAMEACCRERKLRVVLQDGIDYLSEARKGSLNVVTAFHVIEHLPFDRLMCLLTEAHRVLKRGGLLIVETPNPDNLIVAAKNFYTDPTHRNPLPSVLTSFLAEHAGFGKVEVVNQHPFGATMLLNEDGPVAARLNELFYSEQDYAVIATKP